MQIEADDRLPVLLLDGGLGTTLEAPPHNVRFTFDTPLWSSHLLLTDPSTLRSVHRAFVDAGADIVLTATYQASVEGFTLTNPRYTREDAERHMRSAIPLARAAFAPASTPSALSSTAPPGKKARVALSLGPYGATMTPAGTEYTGLYPSEMDSEAALRKWHADRLRIFALDDASWSAVEFVSFETIKRSDEVRAIRGAVSDVVVSGSTRTKPWWISGVFPSEEVEETDVRQWVRTALGPVRDAAAADAYLPRPWGIGLNCTRIGKVERIVRIMEEEVALLVRNGGFTDEWAGTRSRRPWLVLYPDGTKGERYDPAAKQWVQKTEERPGRPWEDVLSGLVKRVRTEGDAWEGLIVGGCCRTGPGDITALERKVKECC